MKLIIAGGRTVHYSNELWALLSKKCVELGLHGAQPGSSDHVKQVVSGGCRGADELGETWAVNQCIPVKVFEADWEMYGRAAGPMRNREMAEYADALLLIWDGKSRGSANMKKEMEKQGKPIFEILVGGDK